MPFSVYLIVCPLLFLAGFVDSIAGGGGLISVPAFLLAGLPAHNAIGTNKMAAGMGIVVSTARLSKAGQIPWKKVWIYMLCAVLGSSSGARLALLVPDRIFKIIMLFVIPLTAVYILFFKPTSAEKEPLPEKQTVLRASLIALLTGVYDGFYGPGTGTFMILLLTAAAHYRLGESNGVTKAINMASNLSALSIYLLNGKVLLPLGIIAGFFNMAGAYIGIGFFHKKGSRIVLPLMLTVLSVFFVRLIYELFLS
jgi:uncharacterized membrane protein YfcA